MRVVVAEKPSMARSIAAALGIRGAGDGCIVGEREIITWCIGHLAELAPPEVYDGRWERWSLATLPILPDEFQLVPAERTRAQLRIVRELLARPDVTEVVNACDSGREGELIFDYVFRLAGCAKPVLRLWTASLTDEAIRSAYRKLAPAAAFAGLRDAARSRSEADWLVGLNGTRAQTLVAQRGGERGVWSVGRVQTPTLALVVERDRAIREFVPADYFTVEAGVIAEGGKFETRWFRLERDKPVDRLDKQADAEKVGAAARQGPARVAAVDDKDVRLPAERLYDLTTLQREANRRFGYSAKYTLDVAQALYEKHKVLSYPRTGSRHLTQDVAATLPALLTSLEGQAGYAAFAAQARAHAQTRGKLGPRFVDDTKVEDHHALLPTGRAPGRLDEAETRIYDLVVRRLLAAFYPDRIEARTQVTCDLGGEKFRARGIVIKELGYSAVDPQSSASGGPGASGGSGASGGAAAGRKPDSGDRPLPHVRVGEPLQIGLVRVSARKTQPPRPFTDAELLGAMETAGRTLDDEELRLAMRESGLGTPATRAAMIEHLIVREYVAREKKNLSATPRGIALIQGLRGAALKSPQLTGEWEAKLARMSRGQYARTEFMAEIAAYTRELVGQIAGGPAPRGGGAAAAPVAGVARAAPARSAAPAPPVRSTATAASVKPAAPAARACTCGQAARSVFSQGKQQWFHRCDPCGRWV